MKKYYFHRDAGHGWLAVSVADCFNAGIASQISEFSYIKGKTVYLEEDRDASIFLSMLNPENYQIVDAKFYNRSPIRNYNSFTLDSLRYI